ncbi:MAG: hypothetical protein IJF61_01610 [Clostridia bacterium]|nr:hypothetical protein [Clostridia bacterium]
MKLNWIKRTVICSIIAVLCVGLLYQYVNSKKDNTANAVLVMAYYKN